MAKGSKKIYARIRIETIETMIGFNMALDRDTVVTELRRLARHASIVLDENAIHAAYLCTTKEVAR